MAGKSEHKRLTFSPGEFAALFGKFQTWGYRQIYAGKVRTITEFGRILIPAAEVEKILSSAGRYKGKATPPQTKAEFQNLGPALKAVGKISCKCAARIALRQRNRETPS